MKQYLIVGILQIIFSILRVFDIKWSYDKQTVKLMVLNLALNGVWIVSTAIGVGAIIKGDIGMMIVYMVSSSIGKWIAIEKFQQNNAWTNKL